MKNQAPDELTDIIKSLLWKLPPTCRLAAKGAIYEQMSIVREPHPFYRRRLSLLKPSYSCFPENRVNSSFLV
ncbi:hypothetical protein Csa_020862 [Cucumis sativus]|nr:hypothetical protein Csa_020862 [Cucumis sativus]